MIELPPEGRRRPAAEFWITLALLFIATLIMYILIFDKDRRDQIKLEKKTTFLQHGHTVNVTSL
jgi:preprotein translocase subunit YajC